MQVLAGVYIITTDALLTHRVIKYDVNFYAYAHDKCNTNTRYLAASALAHCHQRTSPRNYVPRQIGTLSWRPVFMSNCYRAAVFVVCMCVFVTAVVCLFRACHYVYM